MKRQRLWPLLLPIASIGLTVFFLTLTRWLGGFGITCGILNLTGFYCPGCGGTRCAIALSHGHISQAWGYNALLSTGAVLFTLISLYLIIRITLLGKTTLKTPNIHPYWIWFGVMSTVLFSILRNTNTFSWLAP